MTIAPLPRRADAIVRFARFSSAVRGVAVHRVMARPAAPSVNEGRWAALPGEYSGPRAHPLDRTLPAMTAPGTSAPVACGGHGPVILHLAGAWTGHVTFEGSADGATWSRLTLAALDGGPNGTATDRPGIWRTLPGQPVAFIRVRVTHLSAGAVLIAVAAAPAAHRTAHETLDSAA